ncbi:MAG TPA: hypothetical protein VLU95_04845 [Candidatus Acidoferrum sp.]|nr:hypothetical protein [Candidatus Acidoferrum sp.]
MADVNYLNFIWYTDYLGVGYLYVNKGWQVFPLFNNPANAKKLWKNEIEPIEEETLKKRFIEHGNEYKFVLYPFPFQKNKLNFGFYRSLNSSGAYNKFKRSFFGKVSFAFATIGDGIKPYIFNKTKQVSDVKFMKNTDLVKNSVEWFAEKSQQERVETNN